MDYNQYNQIPQYNPNNQYDFYSMNFAGPMMWNQNTVDEQDMEYLKNMYPKGMKQIQRVVEEECDRMEYEGSPIYDDYPDQITLSIMCNRIMDNMQVNGVLAEYGQALDDADEEYPEEEIQAYEWSWRRKRRRNSWLNDTIAVLLFNELHRRRRRFRERRRFW